MVAGAWVAEPGFELELVRYRMFRAVLEALFAGALLQPGVRITFPNAAPRTARGGGVNPAPGEARRP